MLSLFADKMILNIRDSKDFIKTVRADNFSKAERLKINK